MTYGIWYTKLERGISKGQEVVNQKKQEKKQGRRFIAGG